MNIYTSYFAKALKLDQSKYMVVGIARTTPMDAKIAIIPTFAPSSDLLMMYKGHRIDNETYTFIYREEMKYIDIREELKTIAPLAKGRDLVLCCWEGKGKFCHRHILADIIQETYNYQVNEL